MSLKEEYAQAWRNKKGLGLGWIVNLEPTKDLPLGAVGVVDGEDFRYETTLALRKIVELGTTPDENSDPTPWLFQSNDSSHFSLGNAVTTAGAVGAIGQASWDIGVQFGSSAGAVAWGMSQSWDRYEDIGVVRARLLEAVKEGTLHVGESVVVERQLSGAGFVVTTESANASWNATVSADIAPGGGPDLASASADFAVGNASAATDYKRFGSGSVLAARVLQLGYRGFFWWREVAVFGGVEDIDPAQVEAEVMTGGQSDGWDADDDQYFLLT